MTAPVEFQKFAQVAQKISPHGKLLRTWELQGGVSAQVTALEIELPDGQTARMVVRRYGDADLQHKPHVAAHEFKLLQLLQAEGLPVAAPHFCDESGAIFVTPYIVIAFVEAESECAPANRAGCIHQLATQLARIHRIAGPNRNLSFLPKLDVISANKLARRPETLDDSLSEGQIRDALEPVWPLPQRNSSVLLHGDYWPGNILWRDGRLVAILDWEDAAVGDPLADLANSRLELLWAFGGEAMQSFTRQYQAMTAIDCSNLPYWDLYAALRPANNLAAWGLDDATEQAMRARHSAFVAQALQDIAARRRA